MSATTFRIDDVVVPRTSCTRATHENYVYALNADLGEEQWRFHIDSIDMVPPIVPNGVAYVVSDTLYALDVDTVESWWSLAATVLRPERWSTSFDHNPVVSDETLFVIANGTLCVLQ